MGRFVYIQINLFASLMLLILYMNSKSKFPFSRNSKRFRKIMILIIIILTIDTIIRLLDGQDGEWVRTLLWINIYLYYALIDVLAFAWFLYSYACLYEDKDLIEDKKLILITLLPLLVFLLIITGWPGLVYGVDEQNHYWKGRLFLMQYGLWMMYMIGTAILAFNVRRKEKMREKRDEYMQLAHFPVLPIIGGAIQLLGPGLATIWPFTVASIVMVYVNMQRTQISLDPMTGLNNRSRFNQFIQYKIDSDKNKNPWYLLLIDVDDFKQINDTYGHMAGDGALKRMASILKRTFGKMNAFLARYGGDEFVAVLECRREKDIQYALWMLDELMESESYHESVPYQLRCSTGYVKFDPETMKTREQLIAAADEQMYRVKKKRKA